MQPAMRVRRRGQQRSTRCQEHINMVNQALFLYFTARRSEHHPLKSTIALAQRSHTLTVRRLEYWKRQREKEKKKVNKVKTDNWKTKTEKELNVKSMRKKKERENSVSLNCRIVCSAEALLHSTFYHP